MAVQLSTQQLSSNEAESHWNSRSVPLQQITGRGDQTGEEGGKGCIYSDELYVNYSAASCLSFLSLNLRPLLHFLPSRCLFCSFPTWQYGEAWCSGWSSSLSTLPFGPPSQSPLTCWARQVPLREYVSLVSVTGNEGG